MAVLDPLLLGPSVATKRPRATEPAMRTAASAAQGDTSSFGQSGVDPMAPIRPTSVPSAPAPVAQPNDYRETARKTAEINARDGGFNDQRADQLTDAVDQNNQIARTSAGRSGIEVPFPDSGTNNPIKNTVN